MRPCLWVLPTGSPCIPVPLSYPIQLQGCSQPRPQAWPQPQSELCFFSKSWSYFRIFSPKHSYQLLNPFLGLWMCVPIGGMRWDMTARNQSGLTHVCLFKQESDRETYIISLIDHQIQVPLFMWGCAGFFTDWEWPEQHLLLLRLMFKMMVCRSHGEKIAELQVHTWIDILALPALAPQLFNGMVSYSLVVGP